MQYRLLKQRVGQQPTRTNRAQLWELWVRKGYSKRFVVRLRNWPRETRLRTFNTRKAAESYFADRLELGE